MGGIDAHKAVDVRTQLDPLQKLAERLNICVSVVTHPPKNAGQRALDQFIGSQAFIAVPRVGHLCVEEIEGISTAIERQRGACFSPIPKTIS